MIHLVTECCSSIQMVATLPDEVPESGLSWITVGKNIDISLDQSD